MPLTKAVSGVGRMGVSGVLRGWWVWWTGRPSRDAATHCPARRTLRPHTTPPYTRTPPPPPHARAPPHAAHYSTAQHTHLRPCRARARSCILHAHEERTAAEKIDEIAAISAL